MRWHTVLYILLGTTPLLLSANAAFAQNALNATVGTTGLGLEWVSSLHPKLRVRGVLSYLTFERDETEEGIDYTIDVEGNNFGAILDWHPFSGSFRLSAGLVSTNLGFDFKSEQICPRSFTFELIYSSAFTPVTASMRLTPEAMLDSAVILNTPIDPVFLT